MLGACSSPRLRGPASPGCRSGLGTERSDLHAILDAGLICHLGLVRDGTPVVIPTGYGRIGDTVYLHASSGSGWARAIDGAPVCLTVTHLDAIVNARSVFDHSMN